MDNGLLFPYSGLIVKLRESCGFVLKERRSEDALACATNIMGLSAEIVMSDKCLIAIN